jgi:hypothetical protein
MNRNKFTIPLNQALEVRRIAREHAAKPAGTKIIPDKRNKPAKHKKALRED